MQRWTSRCLLTAILAMPAAAWAEDPASKSAALARELAAALDAKKLDSIAAKDPAGNNVYVGALYMPGIQLLVIAGPYEAPMLLDSRLAQKQYRDIYIDLNGASPVAQRILVEDLGIDGLKVKREDDAPADNVEVSGKRTIFDSEWKKQKLSEDDYMKTYATSDARYAEMLSALLAEVKKGS